MKHMKRIFALLLAVLMVAGMTVTAAADENAPAPQTGNYTITINGDCPEHTYEAYQIFTGDLHLDQTTQKYVLSNLKWGKNVNNHVEGTNVEEDMDSLTVDEAIALVNFTSTAVGESQRMENSYIYIISNLPAGYYLVKDKDGTLTGDTAAYTSYILEVVEDSTVSPKSSAPKFEKKVMDRNDSEGSNSRWQDSADYDIGDYVPFHLSAELSGNLESYMGTYKVVFHDTLSEGLTYEEDSPNPLKVYLDGVEKTSGFETHYDNTTRKLTVTIANAKTFGARNSSKITVAFVAKLNESAKIGSEGNPNVAYLEYSNNPYHVDNEGHEPETGKTPDDKVIVFTYKLEVNKIHQVKKEDGTTENQPLHGANFELWKLDGVSDAYKIISDMTKTGDTTFTWKGLDDGDYKLVETGTPSGYNTIDPIFFTISAEHDVLSDNPELTSLNGETASGEVTFTYDVDKTTLSTDVLNQKGATLPETGGMGTTLFYIVGGVMVLAAVVLLISKKRMTDSE